MLNKNPNLVYTDEVLQVTHQQAQILAEIRYTVYQDLQNLINLLYSMSEVTQAFKNSADKTMVTISKNKIILQLNLSNTIHRDLEQRFQKDKLVQSELTKVKAYALKIAQSAKIDPELQVHLNTYKNNNLCQNVQERQIPLEKVNVQGNFNENVLQQIVSAIQTTDQLYEKIRQNPQQRLEPTIEEVLYRAEQYKSLTKQKIINNFPMQRR